MFDFARFRRDLRLIWILPTALAVKVLCSTITFSADFRNLSESASFTQTVMYFQGPYTFTVYLMNLFYRVWLWLPIEHMERARSGWTLESTMISPTPEIIGYILALKAPIILFDFLTGMIVYKSILKLSHDKKDAMLGLVIWLFNPYLTLSIEMDGTIDIVSAFFLILGIYLFMEKKWELAGLSLAIGTFARFYPIVILPFFIILAFKRGGLKRALRIFGGFIGGFTVFTLPFILKYRGEFFSLLTNLTVGGNKEFIWFFGHFFTVVAPPNAKISIVAILYTLLIILLFRKHDTSKYIILDVILILLVGYLAFSHWNRYYSIWVIPLVTIDYVVYRRKAGIKEYKFIFCLLFLGWFLFGARWHIANFFHIQYVPEIFKPLKNAVVNAWSWLSAGYLMETFSRAWLATISIIYMIYLYMRNISNLTLKIIRMNTR